MTPDPLDEVSRVYHAALERASGERRAFLQEACAGNEALKREVASLLGYQDAAVEFIEAPALLAAAEGFGHDGRSAVMTGRQIGSYTVLALIDAGGMGEVYRARDTKLGRDVAIKVLPPAFMTDPARRARFEREAHLLATVNHPNIAQIYGLEESDGAQALVMELVPGETLAALLQSTVRDTSRTTGLALSLDGALSIARQMVDAIEAAHEKGVLHRDLKPANVRVTPEGVVKVLDFGLAKAFAVDPAQTSPRESHVPVTGGVTSDGIVLGTAAYMSPDQARGLPVDKRTDIWAFGCVLYEMLTGARAFEGPTISDTLAAILQREPDWDALPAATPSRVRELVQRCLVKDPRRRLRDIGDARSHLESEEPVAPQAAPFPGVSRTRERVWMSVAALTVIAAIAAIGSRGGPPTAVSDEVRFPVQPPDGYTFPILPGFLAISPDGRHLAFVAIKDGRNQLFVRDLDRVVPRLLPGTEGAWQPTWSPDSRFVAFIDSFSGGRLKRVDRLGGTPLTIADWSNSMTAWSPHGVILLTGRDGRLYRIPESGGQPIAVVEPDPGRQEIAITRPVFLPDGRRFIFQALSQNVSKNALFMASLDGAGRTHLLDGLSTFDYTEGYLLYQREGTLMAHPFDHEDGRLIGEATPVVENLMTAERGFAAFTIADNGTLAYRTAGEAAATLTWFNQQGNRVGTVADPGAYGNPQLSRDGRWLAVSRKDGGQHDIWVVDLERNVPVRLTTDPAADDFPVWSDDGRHVIFASSRKGVFDLYRRAADGSGTDEMLFESAEIKRPTDISPGGRFLLFTARTGAGVGRLDVWGLPLTGDRKPFPIMASPGSNELNAVFSPDGRWIAYQGSDTGAPEIYLQPFPTTGARIRVSTAPGTFPKWTAGGKQIFYNGLHALTVVDVTDPRRPGAPRSLFPWSAWDASWVVDRDGQRFLRAAPPDPAAAESMTVILNWAAGLRRK